MMTNVAYELPWTCMDHSPLGPVPVPGEQQDHPGVAVPGSSVAPPAWRYLRMTRQTLWASVFPPAPGASRVRLSLLGCAERAGGARRCLARAAVADVIRTTIADIWVAFF